MIIKFIKTGKYITNLPSDQETYTYLCGVASQTVDPFPIMKSSFNLSAPFQKIFYSTLNRVGVNFKNKDGANCVPSSDLREVLFDLRAMCTYDEWKREKSVIVRRKFKEFFIEDKLPQKRKDIFQGIKSFIFNQCKRQHNVIAISHSFKMKLFQAFIETKGEIEYNPELINKYIFDDKKTFEFLEEVVFEVDCNKFITTQ